MGLSSFSVNYPYHSMPQQYESPFSSEEELTPLSVGQEPLFLTQPPGPDLPEDWTLPPTLYTPATVDSEDHILFHFSMTTIRVFEKEVEVIEADGRTSQIFECSWTSRPNIDS